MEISPRASRMESNINRELPVNLPTRQEIIKNSHLSETDFDESRYREYIQSFHERVQLLREQEAHLRSDFNALKPYYSEGSIDFRKHFDLVEDLLRKLSSNLHSVFHQRDLFPQSDHWFLAETQVDELSMQVRDLKHAMSNLYSIGTYHSTSRKASLRDEIGPGQYARVESSAMYARAALQPRETEKYFGNLLSLPENVRHETVLVANGMAALTTALALVKSEKYNGNYLIAANPYYELTKAFKQMLDERGVKEAGFQPPETLLQNMKENNPDVIIVEPIQNNADMQEIDVASLVSIPTKHEKRFFILDYTLSGQNFAISDYVDKATTHDVFILISSVHKMYEQGDDITPAGVIHVVGKGAVEIESVVEKIRTLRSMLGTNIAVPSLLLLQKISLGAVEAYSSSIERNVTTLSRALQKVDCPLVKKIVTAPTSATGVSRGLFFIIQFHEKSGPSFIGKVLEKAREHNLQVTEKFAFGYRHTSLCLFGDEAVVRIAPGIEDSRKIEVLKRIFTEVLTILPRESKD